jgi:Ca2+-binding EF-hand superfamily protein
VSSFDDLDKEGSAILTVDGLLTAFRTIDVQEKGRLDLVGFTMVLDEVGLVWSKAETQERFERADTNHDGYITFDELQRMLDDL